MLTGEVDVKLMVSTDLFLDISKVRCCRIRSVEIRNLSWL